MDLCGIIMASIYGKERTGSKKRCSMKTHKTRASTDEEIEPGVVQKQVPEIRVVKGKKRPHKRDGCGGGGGAGGGGGGSFSGGGSVGPALAGLAGNSPVDVEIVKATRDNTMGAIIRDQEIEDVSALEYQQAGGKISKKM